MPKRIPNKFLQDWPNWNAELTIDTNIEALGNMELARSQALSS